MREVVTLQFGGFSNYIGTHFWNLQEEHHNFSEDLNPMVLYRAGEVRNQAVYMPRVVAFDVKGSTGFLCKSGYVYNDPNQWLEQAPFWSGQVERAYAPKPRRNAFVRSLFGEDEDAMAVERDDAQPPEAAQTDADADADAVPRLTPREIRHWTDYLRPHLHPRSIAEFAPSASTRGQAIARASAAAAAETATTTTTTTDAPVDVLQQFMEGRAVAQQGSAPGEEGAGSHGPAHLHPPFACPWASWDEAYDAARPSEQLEEVEDALHFFLEECEHLQAFHFLVDASTPWSGFANGLLTTLRDDYPKTPVSLFACMPQRTWDFSDAEHAHAVMSQCVKEVGYFAQTCADTAELNPSIVPLVASHWTPQSFPYLMPDLASPYHTSAILAAALDSFSLPYRQRRQACIADHVLSQLVPVPSMHTLGLQFAFPIVPREEALRAREARELAPTAVDRLFLSHDPDAQVERTEALREGASLPHVLDKYTTPVWPPPLPKSEEESTTPTERILTRIYASPRHAEAQPHPLSRAMTGFLWQARGAPSFADEIYRAGRPTWSEGVFMRGVPLSPPGVAPPSGPHAPASNVDEMLQLYLRACPSLSRRCYTFAKPFPMSSTFPSFFSSRLNARGFRTPPAPDQPYIGADGRLVMPDSTPEPAEPQPRTTMESCPSLLRASTSPALAGPLLHLADILQARRYSGHVSAPSDEISEAITALREQAEAYCDD